MPTASPDGTYTALQTLHACVSVFAVLRVCLHRCFVFFSVSGYDCIFVREGGVGQYLCMFSNKTESLQTNFCLKAFLSFII